MKDLSEFTRHLLADGNEFFVGEIPVTTSTLTDSNGIFRCWRLPLVGAVAGALSSRMTLGDDSLEVFATV
ncbi:hypothetical protein, partial [Candidatus Accumulibacter phosphatis]|uniref:hypothetical protein n=1 Tax=Candidatus Accumulibacter phosphatis TaxID=327160 RepID=UPI001BB11C69